MRVLFTLEGEDDRDGHEGERNALERGKTLLVEDQPHERGHHHASEHHEHRIDPHISDGEHLDAHHDAREGNDGDAQRHAEREPGKAEAERTFRDAAFYKEKERDGEVGKEGEFQRAVKARPLIALILLRDQKLRGENECGKYQQKIIDEHYSFSFCLFFPATFPAPFRTRSQEYRGCPSNRTERTSPLPLSGRRRRCRSCICRAPPFAEIRHVDGQIAQKHRFIGEQPREEHIQRGIYVYHLPAVVLPEDPVDEIVHLIVVGAAVRFLHLVCILDGLPG